MQNFNLYIKSIFQNFKHLIQHVKFEGKKSHSLNTLQTERGCRGHDRMVVGFTTTYAISAYHH